MTDYLTPNLEKEDKLLNTDFSEQKLLEHPTYKKLEEKLNEAEIKANDNWNKILRLQAELDNFKKRAERDIANAHKYANEKFAREIINVVDNLERSLQVKTSVSEELKEFYTGIELTLKLFLETLLKFGIKPINPQNELFNPEQHTAISVKEDKTIPTDTIVEVIQKGYWLNDRLLRPAMVIVNKN